MLIDNVAAYKFVPLADLETLQIELKERCQQLSLKGTILLASEGINLFLAGQPSNLKEFLAFVQANHQIGPLEVKHSPSAEQPFKKLLVKIKPEIVTMKHSAANPLQGRAPAVSPKQLKAWLDQGHDDDNRPLVLLDTRNAFEVDLGSFEGAIDYRISKFSEFPQAVKEAAQSLSGQRVVTFCTGGIRCEKAALYMQQQGIENVTQLDGGILKYFEEIGQVHYRGHCFVFDERRNLDAQLRPVVE
jgi:UPF0176 protein